MTERTCDPAIVMQSGHTHDPAAFEEAYMNWFNFWRKSPRKPGDGGSPFDEAVSGAFLFLQNEFGFKKRNETWRHSPLMQAEKNIDYTSADITVSIWNDFRGAVEVYLMQNAADVKFEALFLGIVVWDCCRQQLLLSRIAVKIRSLTLSQVSGSAADGLTKTLLPWPSVSLRDRPSPFRVMACASELPESYEHYRREAELLEEIDLSSHDGAPCFFAVGRGLGRPELVVAQRYRPAGYGFYPGLLLVPETMTVFIGAGERLLAYNLDPSPRRLWVDHADTGFWNWCRFDEYILMSAELELAAWTLAGVKLWSTFVELPWQYDVANGKVNLDVMGTRSSFDIARGPASGK